MEKFRQKSGAFSVNKNQSREKSGTHVALAQFDNGGHFENRSLEKKGCKFTKNRA